MRVLVILLACVGSASAASAEPDSIYAELCASCHGAKRYGGYAPPLTPESLERKDTEALVAAIREGLPNTQMPAFGDRVDAERARSVVALLRQPVGPIRWDASDITASRVELPTAESKIPASIRRENLTLVVERGSGSVSVLDGDSLRELDRFPVGRIHGGLKFDGRLREVLAATRDGTLVGYDLVRGELRRKVKVGVNTRNVAISPLADFVAVANQVPRNLVVLNGEFAPLAVFPLAGQPSAVYQVPGQDRFVLTLRDLPLLLSVGYPELELRELKLPEPFEDFVFVSGSARLVASSRGGSRLLLYDLDAEKTVSSLETEALPHLFSACFFQRGGALFAAFNHIGAPRLSLVDMDAFQVVSEIPLAGSGYFVRTHPATPYLWIDTNTEKIQLVRKDSLELEARSLVPEAGKNAMHVEFTADGDRALVSIWHEKGAVVVYDARSLEEVARLPYHMPVGKYNAANKTRSLR